MVEKAGIDVDQLLDLLVKNAAAELTTYYYYTILRANLIGLEGEGIKEIAEAARIEDRNHFEALVPRIYELGGKLPAALFGNGRNRLLTHVEHGSQRQGHGAPQWMTQRQRDRDPDVAIKIFLVRRSRRGIPMNVGSLDLRTVAFRRRIVDHHGQPIWQGNGVEHEHEQPPCYRFGLVSEGRQEVIIVLEVVADPSRAQPRGDGAPSSSKQNSDQKQGESPAISPVQSGCKPLAPFLPIVRTSPLTPCSRHPWLLRCAADLATAA